MARMSRWAAFGALAVLCATFFLARIREVPVSAAVSPVVVIDPGHGGVDPGAIAGPQGPYEKNINLAISLLVADLLRAHHIQTYLTRTGDTLPYRGPLNTWKDLQTRGWLSRYWHATLFVTIHSNAEPSGRAYGPLVYYRPQSPPSRILAGYIAQSLGQATGIHGGPRPIRQMVLRLAGVPAVNVEVGFVSHRIDQSKLVNAAYQMQLAQGISAGIRQYLQRPRG